MTHAAPAHHFAGLSGLIAAIAVQACGQFAKSVQARQQRAPATACDQLLAMRDGHPTFAARHDPLFRIMFASPAVDRSDSAVAAGAARARGLLRSACAPFGTAPGPDTGLDHSVFALIHGYAMPGLWQRGGPPQPAQGRRAV